MAVKVSLEELLESGAHFGHQVRRWNPKIKEFVFGEQEGVHVFDLVKTKESLEAALDVITKASKEGKTILLLATKKQAKDKALEVAKETGISLVSERWLGGTITNFNQIKKSLDKLADMKVKFSTGYYAKYTKKERLLIEREITRLERFFGGITNLRDKPDIMIVVDIRKEITAIREANRKGITTIGIVDTNSDPNMVDYPIPMNDDATKALALVLEYIKEAILEGKGITNKVNVIKETPKKVKKPEAKK
ncbi:30S ribosomal protein S2 [Candidatus Woesebacteria bacterium RIFOXYC1_FULL_31_51]|uniref:Small ribosomal subunit protein uS2 n=1 Tax=Candidatus Woesebacteria bacterium GW2011_GWC2_31_9 TaxID=1618586 RepID=A0A0G0B0E7_9BACT|nr:MAG: 30S ribosomal protein S2, small subunit ribosomal protein S2 [Candidatus Woesebacteria bacterium GW2011_GWF1_31_35]KKP22803.1 MAG: 30S ribosomal protein S2 [Candidatus Woesebacteria bacterium GW2011_GWC1_30_29]KKP26709.1 MAG: 30S ribosomal protein S2 [Candidatus Woesebacteria bacterium GW2011_GWD1_31_12]KKP28051.1 MAG: 30S ribosomal protein S2 [Candidatus Woesebacteria bacterium GW2011_GWB1_31_29]KKP32280.1 MAG: 30S ribosomal protein S2 [Candidatus Woesebacteria bacterium GW2011_GWC2_31